MILQGLDLLWIILPIIIFISIFFACWLLAGIKVILEYERLVIFRLGKYKRTIARPSHRSPHSQVAPDSSPHL